MQPLACCFKTRKNAVLCSPKIPFYRDGFLWNCFIVSCMSTAFFCSGCQSVPNPETAESRSASGGPVGKIELPQAPAGAATSQGSSWSRLPGELRNSSGEVSLPLEGYTADQSNITERRKTHRARRTDQEVAGNSRKSMDERHGAAIGTLDQNLELEPVETENNAPSFSLSVKNIKDLYKKRKLEEALIETNELIRFYPESAQLYTMKGTLHQKMAQLDLALKSFQRAYEIEPSRKLLSQIEHLESLTRQRDELRQQEGNKKW